MINKKTINYDSLFCNTGLTIKAYRAIHVWIGRNWGKASKCEMCNNSDENIRYEWALIKGKSYDRNKDSYMELCVFCHRKYDMTEDVKKKISKIKMGCAATRKRAVIRINISSGERKIYDTVRGAAIENKISHSGICMCAKGVNKQCAGYKWEYLLLHTIFQTTKTTNNE